MTLLKALVALVPVVMLLSGSILFFVERKAVYSLLQTLGSGCLLLVVLAHICEGLRLFAWMGFGLPYSVGHYVDLFAAVLGVTLFPTGYLLHALTNRGRA